MLAVAGLAHALPADLWDRGYVVPQAWDDAVASVARWGSRPMAEHRVMSEDLLGKRITDREDATNRTQWNRKPA